ncbi:hypothetical protein BC332_09849 [Capsicum chinense]|nr:hypothetical protein BC332_09849 [Capsicum chinense]
MCLPQDILVEILSRVPAKSLVRFRCVSKWFNCLTSDVQFQDKHLKISCSSRDLESKRVAAKVGVDVMLSCSLSSVYNNKITAWRLPIERKISSCSKISSMVLVCPPVNGLVCVTLGTCLHPFDNVHLWNPTINELRRLANSSVPLDLLSKLQQPYGEPIYGLGHDSASDDYVVVRVITRLLGYSMPRVEVYSLKKDSWRLLIQPFPYPYIWKHMYFNCHFMNSRFHWMAYTPNNQDHLLILSLNLSDYEYKEIPQPNYQKVSPPRDYFINIAVLDGQLCFCIHYFGRSLDLWTMKDYGVQQSWMMMLSIPLHDFVDTPIQLHVHADFFPLYLFENGDVLLLRLRQVVVWEQQHSPATEVVGRKLQHFLAAEVVIWEQQHSPAIEIVARKLQHFLAAEVVALWELHRCLAAELLVVEELQRCLVAEVIRCLAAEFLVVEELPCCLVAPLVMYGKPRALLGLRWFCNNCSWSVSR